MQAAASNQAGKAIARLSKARKLDAGITGTFGARIRKTVAKMYEYRAWASFARKKYAQAAGFARKAYGRDTSLTGAQTVLNKVQEKARGFLSEAKRIKKTNPDRAMSLLQKAKRIFPRSDPAYREAAALLNALADQEDEE